MLHHHGPVVGDDGGGLHLGSLLLCGVVDVVPGVGAQVHSRHSAEVSL